MKVVSHTLRFLVPLVMLVGITAGLPSAYAGLHGAYFGGIPDESASSGAGVLLGEVKPGSPADDAGLQTGDVILEFGGVPVNSADELLKAVRTQRPEEPVAVTYVRQGQEHQTYVTLKAQW
jgi:putative serine protease PepD